jgi:DNA-binding XRE family transcriptional regulator
MRTIKRIVKIHGITGYKVYCLFNTGESRVIDFEKVFDAWKIKPGDLEYPLKASQSAFAQAELTDGALTWKNIVIESVDEHGDKIVHPYEIDPIVCYELSEEDSARSLAIGLMIKQARKEMGLTQEELARKSGTTKHYISKVENDKSGIELSTLLRIIEGGLGKRLELKIV